MQVRFEVPVLRLLRGHWLYTSTVIFDVVVALCSSSVPCKALLPSPLQHLYDVFLTHLAGERAATRVVSDTKSPTKGRYVGPLAWTLVLLLAFAYRTVTERQVAQREKPRETDIFIVSYPKSGEHVLGYILLESFVRVSLARATSCHSSSARPFAFTGGSINPWGRAVIVGGSTVSMLPRAQHRSHLVADSVAQNLVLSGLLARPQE